MGLRKHLVVACWLLAWVPVAGGASTLSLAIQEPAPEAVLPPSEGSVEVVGAASIYGGVQALDLFLVLDSSESLRRTDPQDHRTAGVVELVRSLHPRANIHIGVVDFDRHAKLLMPLTADRDAVVRALHLLDQKGETDIAKGIRTALAGFAERGRVGASRVILLFTDGKSDEQEALQAMAEARAEGVAIHTLLLGDESDGESLLRRIASGTLGSFVHVRDPERLSDAFLNLRTTGVDRVMLRANGGPPIQAQLVGGAFTGRVPVRPGENRIEATATSLAGETATTSVTVSVSGALHVHIETPADGSEIDAAGAETRVEGTATTWDEASQGPVPPGADPGVHDVWLRVNGSDPIRTQLSGGHFVGHVRLADGENRIVALATTTDGRTAEDTVTLVHAPGCAELRVSALRGNEPALSISERAIEIVFDASNSMWGRMQGEPKISVAKRILGDALDWLPKDLEISLRVYGHQYAYAQRNCRDSELLVPLGPDSREQIRAAIGRFKPRGQTPLAYALQQAATDFGSFRGERAVVLVTDGIESCNGDPAAAARALQAGHPTPVHVIGFGLSGDGGADRAELRAIAAASGGRFLTASSADELREALAAAAGTPFAVRNDQRVVAKGTIGSEQPIRLPAGDYTVRLESEPPYVVPVSLAPEQGFTLMLKRQGRKVLHARRTQPIEYRHCSLPDTSTPDLVWEELPDADAAPAAPSR